MLTLQLRSYFGLISAKRPSSGNFHLHSCHLDTQVTVTGPVERIGVGVGLLLSLAPVYHLVSWDYKPHTVIKLP